MTVEAKNIAEERRASVKALRTFRMCRVLPEDWHSYTVGQDHSHCSTAVRRHHGHGSLMKKSV